MYLHQKSKQKKEVDSLKDENKDLRSTAQTKEEQKLQMTSPASIKKEEWPVPLCTINLQSCSYTTSCLTRQSIK